MKRCACVIPLWLGSGIADRTRHYATHIETTCGAKETLIHLLTLVEMGAPVLALVVNIGRAKRATALEAAQREIERLVLRGAA